MHVSMLLRWEIEHLVHVAGRQRVGVGPINHRTIYYTLVMYKRYCSTAAAAVFSMDDQRTCPFGPVILETSQLPIGRLNAETPKTMFFMSVTLETSHWSIG